MKLENFEECKSIVSKIKTLQEQIDFLCECKEIQFVNSCGCPLFNITLKEPNQSKSIYVESVNFSRQIVLHLTNEQLVLKTKLETL